jgi:hypothetical protein
LTSSISFFCFRLLSSFSRIYERRSFFSFLHCFNSYFSLSDFYVPPSILLSMFFRSLLR